MLQTNDNTAIDPTTGSGGGPLSSSNRSPHSPSAPPVVLTPLEKLLQVALQNHATSGELATISRMFTDPIAVALLSHKYLSIASESMDTSHFKEAATAHSTNERVSSMVDDIAIAISVPMEAAVAKKSMLLHAVIHLLLSHPSSTRFTPCASFSTAP